jgi:site-specific DNA recombinase
MRVIVAARLSVLADGQTGLDSQEREVVAWAERNGHTVVAVVGDNKTGKSHLWDRPNLRPWVTDPVKLSEYDAVVALKVGRLTRADDEGVDAMKAWAREHGKSPAHLVRRSPLPVRGHGRRDVGHAHPHGPC